jgi:hypothetical protein
MPHSEEPLEQKLSTPAYGRTVWSTVAKWTQPLINAYSAMMASANNGDRDKVARAYDNIFSPIIMGTEIKPTQEQKVKLAASAMLSIWMISQCTRKTGQPNTLSEAEEWFLGERFPPQLPRITQVCENWSSKEICATLSSFVYDNDFQDLFPYIVEIFETLSVFRSRNHVPIKRYLGLYYTPSDVCDYIVHEVLKPWETENAPDYPSVSLSCIDPACGSGVFLRAVLDWHSNRQSLKEKYGQFSRLDAIQAIYGMDISHQAIQSCAFTLLLDCIGEALAKGLAPWHVWQAVRGNLAVKDSTRIAGYPNGSVPKPDGYKRSKIRKELLNANTLAHVDAISSSSQDVRSWFGVESFCDVFPEISEGFSVVVGNPPYSRIRKEKLHADLVNAQVYSKSRNELLDTAYLPFVRMMWGFANKRYARAGMVLPLSVAYHSGKDFCTLRRAIMAKGSWHFSFFDRTPDSLFGDDIKTRNCIAVAEFSEKGKSIATTNLRRWNSQNRKHLFSNITFTELSDISIEHMIPKVGSEQELLVYKLLMSQKEKLGSLVKPFCSHGNGLNDSRVYFRSTAYNWIPLFRNLPMIPSSARSVSSTFNCLEFLGTVEADFGFAVASSHVAYWLWRVEGDGFHLNRNFLTRLPIHPTAFSEASIQKLCHLSHALWEKLQVNPMKKFNAGVLALSYSPYDCTTIIEEIDKLLIEAYNLPDDFLLTLQRFVAETIEAGRVNSFQLRQIMEKIRREGKQ